MSDTPGTLGGIDHVAITVADVEATTAFLARLFLVDILREHHSRQGHLVVRVVRIGGGAQLSLHQLGNGVTLAAARPTPGSVDICFRWIGPIEAAVEHLSECGVAIIDGPSPRVTAAGRPARSVYFRDPDANLLELMAEDGSDGTGG